MSKREIWLRSIAAAAVGGASTALSAWLAAPQAFNFTEAGLIAFAKVILLGAGVPVLAYLQKSPLPDVQGQDAKN
jgi:hypothetical protein